MWVKNFIQGLLVFIWALGTPLGWIWFYFTAGERFSDPEQFLSALRAFSIPYLVFSIAVLVVILFGANMRSLMELKNTIDSAPQLLGAALQNATEIKRNIDEAGSDLNNRLELSIDEFKRDTAQELEKFVSSLRSATTGELQSYGIDSPQSDTDRISKTALNPYLTCANRIFYPALDDHNSDRRREPITVNRGGGNRAKLARDLRDKGLLTEELYRFIEEVFSRQLSLRKKGFIEKSDLDHIARLAEDASISADDLDE